MPQSFLPHHFLKRVHPHPPPNSEVQDNEAEETFANLWEDKEVRG